MMPKARAHSLTHPLRSVLALALACIGWVLWTPPVASASPIVARPSDKIATKPAPVGDRELLAIGPPRTIATVNPGQAISVTFIVSNRTRSPEKLALSAVLLKASDQDSLAQVVADPDPNEAQSWVSLPVGKLNLRAQEQAEFKALVSIPDDARPGVHSVGVSAEVFSSAPSVNTDESAKVGLTSRLISQILITVKGDMNPQIRMSGVVSDRFVWPGEKLRLGIRVANDGNTLGTISGRIRIGKLTGKSIGTLTLSETQILPKGRRVTDRSWNNRPWIGLYKPVATVDTGSDGERTVKLPRVFLLPQWWVFALLILAAVIPLWRYGISRREKGPAEQITSKASEDQAN